MSPEACDSASYSSRHRTISSHNEYTAEIPVFTRNAFNHNTKKYTHSIFILFGTCENGSVSSNPRVRSFKVQIVRSLAAVVLHSSVGSKGLIFSNSLMDSPHSESSSSVHF
jgi:hypothetical protein